MQLCNNATSAAASCAVIVGTYSAAVGARLSGSIGLDTGAAGLLLLEKKKEVISGVL